MRTGSLPTGLDEHRERNAGAAAVRTVQERIAESRVEYVYHQTVTLTGRVVGKVAPAAQLVRHIENGVQMHRAILTDARVDRSGTMLGAGVEGTECTAMPDLDSFGVLPWDTRTGFFFCDLYESAHMPEDVSGRPLAADARGNLKRVHAGFTERTGLELRSGCEPEMTWALPGAAAGRDPHAVSTIYHVDHMEQYRPVYQKVIEYGRALGIDMTEGNCEAPGQLELNWMFDRADRTADRLIVHRQICRQVARETGVPVSFLPKRAAAELGNGCHHNISLWRDGRNVFVDPGLSELHLTETARHALGGVLAHAVAATAVMGPTVNSYKRYADEGHLAPLRINWGMDNKTCAVRVPAVGRLEFKLPDAMVNPYLSHAVLIAAIEDGLVNRTDPGPPEGAVAGDGSDRFGTVPLTLGEALERYAADPVVTRALGPEISRLFMELKADEWGRFCSTVTDWEHAMYGEAGC
ncbi:glutamine synthetase family protein [Streptomyces griseocarneus]|uniref:glutamine synthetase family protein n=1 Tax=Streptomyces griseocarneus TaxID=51201 RepID=UPI00167EB95A|nr:glutamine synthetase family protein [Streptomyces griseocarneus]MBZ6476326.1 glutamine synthetase family protein [Streptomyces griseocarneus]GHG78167.1 glutamine synthetase [Streptomyces griseocarneus]